MSPLSCFTDDTDTVIMHITNSQHQREVYILITVLELTNLVVVVAAVSSCLLSCTSQCPLPVSCSQH